MRTNNEIWARAGRSSGSPLEFYINNSSPNGIKNDQWNHVFIWIDGSQVGNDERQIWINGATGVTTAGYTSPSFSSVKSSDKLVIGDAPRKTHLFPNLTFLSGRICNLYWSNSSNFKNHASKYANLPTVEIN